MKQKQNKNAAHQFLSSEKISADVVTNANVDEMIQELIDVKRPVQLLPKSPDKCPVFCCFYAEFDIKTGPVVRYQSPKNFMDRDIHTTTVEIHEILEKAFERRDNEQRANQDTIISAKSRTKSKNCTSEQRVDYTNDNEVISGFQTPEGESSTVIQTVQVEQTHQSKSSSPHEEEKSLSRLIHCEDKDKENLRDDELYSRNIHLPEGGQSFFDSTSEYIITGSELTGKIITLSTHDVHVMTRPTQITNERYERNALLFSIGMVLRRAADPRPFRPLISKLAMTLRSMEIESGILSDPSKVESMIQPLLEKILISMNSPKWECNILLDRSTALNLKLFHPPKPPALPVHNYHVPVLLVRDFQLGYYEWDLAINWVILHIDGVTNARQISIKAEVDLEMVLACLRVLRHHGVISVVDIFLYSNRYECTDRAAAMLAGKEDKLLQEAVEFAVKRQHPTHLVPPPVPSPRTVSGISSAIRDTSGGSNVGNSSPKSGSSYFSMNHSRSHGTHPSSSYPPRSLNLLGVGGGSQRSTNFRQAMMAANSLEREQTSFIEGPRRHLEERKNLKVALVELYCACNRNFSFGNLWLSLTTELSTSSKVQNLKPSQDFRGSNLSSNFLSSGSVRKDSLTDYDMSENEIVAFSPMESCYLESLRHRHDLGDEKINGSHNNGKPSLSSPSTSSPIDWTEIFKEFDHRRFITFGVINGLLIRVHSYPFFAGPFPERRRVFPQGSNSTVVIIPPESTRVHNKRESIEEKNFQLARSISAMMDGTRFDDELVCTFEKPFNYLVELVEKYSGRKVAHVFARGG